MHGRIPGTLKAECNCADKMGRVEAAPSSEQGGSPALPGGAGAVFQVTASRGTMQLLQVSCQEIFISSPICQDS